VDPPLLRGGLDRACRDSAMTADECTLAWFEQAQRRDPREAVTLKPPAHRNSKTFGHGTPETVPLHHIFEIAFRMHRLPGGRIQLLSPGWPSHAACAAAHDLAAAPVRLYAHTPEQLSTLKKKAYAACSRAAIKVTDGALDAFIVMKWECHLLDVQHSLLPGDWQPQRFNKKEFDAFARSCGVGPTTLCTTPLCRASVPTWRWLVPLQPQPPQLPPPPRAAATSCRVATTRAASGESVHIASGTIGAACASSACATI
jgi:hypothetical protein